MIALDMMLQELIDLEKEVKAKYRRIEEIKAWCKDRGSFSTDLYVCAVKEHTRTGLKGLEEVSKVLGRNFLEELELISTSRFLTVHVSRKSPTELEIAL